MKNQERLRIVMVDDDQDFQLILRSWLSPEYDLVSLSSGEGLLDELAELEPDLVMLDVLMPGPNGYKLCRRIRSDRRFSDLPILFLTGCASDDDFVQHLDAGGTAYLTKPITRRQLLAKVRELVIGVEA
jgi:CheY-like chemotaxis protein